MAFAGARYLAGLALFLTALATRASAGELPPGAEIAWYSADIPPLYIFSGSLEGTGYGDVILDLVAAAKPKRVTVSRTWYEIEHHPVSCTTGALKTPAREAIALFSARPAMVPNYEVIIRADLAQRMAPFLNESGKIELARLTEQSELVGGSIASRVYPGILGEALSSPDHRWRLEKISETPLLMNLLRSNRIDFFFLSPVELAYYRQTLGGDDRWIGIPIEGLPDHVGIYTACSKTDLGAKVIAEVDEILSHDEQFAKVTSVLSSWESRAQLEHLAGGPGAARAHR
ncbi:MAG TPA: hypothetical protein VKP60_15305 [Magnetospirillaceae bacterium]|nr:hypothetical protein [Magnetospirillaceae bacterium]